jgi:hypothetical protein
MPPKDTYRALAAKYAPVIAQKVSKEWRVADQIAPVDLAGSITSVVDNPGHILKLGEDLDKKKDTSYVIPPKVYYSVCETSTHYFILYAVYHVLDWWKRYAATNLYDFIRDQLDEHFHDMEGALVVVTKGPAGLVDAMITVAHLDFYLFTKPMMPTALGKAKQASKDSLCIVKFNETMDGNIWLDKETERVRLYIESRGHGIHGDHTGWGGGDEILYYYPERETAIPQTLDKAEKNTQAVTYKIEDICAPKGLWSVRFDQSVFQQTEHGQWGFVYRDKKGVLKPAAANPPWSWNDHNDTSPIGEIATDPAHFIARYAQGWGAVSLQYVYNPYLGIL